ncbi:hypothetical protein M0R45_021333 [Rubus argutus]|uniref:Uncharacterized protein n=1 Tax=Rubus argutus TaxID=59490 RepID=A0AAW1XDD9_RUBAR
MYIDIRYAVLLAINMFKYGVGMPWDWDPFHTISNLTWTNACLLLILFLVFSFISIKVHVPLTTTHLTSSTTCSTTNTVLVAFEEVSVPLAVALMASALVFPQALFWYAYPFIVLISSCFGELKRFANWFHNVLTAIPVLNVIMTATIVGWQALGTQPHADQIIQANEGNTQALEMRLGDTTEELEADDELV